MRNRMIKVETIHAARAAEGARVLLHVEKDCIGRIFVTTILRLIQ